MKFLLLLILLSGCAATTVQRSTKSQYGPANGQRSLGMVKYLNAGANFVINRRRESSYKAMYGDCGGSQYVIEYEEASGSYWKIFYRCK